MSRLPSLDVVPVDRKDSGWAGEVMGRAFHDTDQWVSLLPDPNGQLTRRIALNLSRLIRGRSVSDLPVLLSVDSKLYINGTTAAAVGYSPDLETLVYAQILNEEALADVGAQPLDFAEALEKAETSNTFLSIQEPWISLTPIFSGSGAS